MDDQDAVAAAIRRWLANVRRYWWVVILLIAIVLMAAFWSEKTRINLWASKINPQTLEFYKAMGTVLVAVIAAAIAGGIQYRQWQTAHKQWQTAQEKSNAELFDRRYKIYVASVDLYEELLLSGDETDWQAIKDKFYIAVLPARWILDEEISNYLRDDYMQLCIKIVEIVNNGPDDESENAFDAYKKRTDKCNEEMKIVIKKVRAMFEPYLKLKIIK
jgi:hypothetical protein